MPSSDVVRPTDRGAALVLACMLGGSAGWAMTAAGAGAATIAPAYDAGLVTVGLMTTALAAPYAALQLPAGALVDRIGPRKASVLGLTLVVVVHVLAATVPLTWLALVCRAAAGAGYAVCFVSGAELVRRSGAGASALGIFGGVSLAASGLSVLVIPLAEGMLGWRAAWVTSGAAALVAVTLVALVPVPAMAVRSPGRPDREDRPAATGWILLDGELHRLAAVHAVTLGLGVVLSNWAAVLLVTDWGFSRPAAALAASLVLGLTVLSRPLGGALALRLPHHRGRVSALSLLACALATLALAAPTVPAVAVVAVVTLGVLGGLPFAAVLAAGQARRPDRPAAAVGLLNSQANGLILLGTPLLGAAIEGAWSSPALVLLAVLWLVPLLVWPRSYRRLGV
ncbi:MFS transporter [Nocardioides mesophilus]|uniref:MFS transporter n=1 Tax=Nocardioides mesophilus TaxID=433659 RepID=A0A7G9RG40_9ACTN|nr:MFS transporter [Nocardioides mesophilus]QNN54565.1 MFS transporter [Nocardioides mesophilus]